jgi:cytoskeleton protein RodZ
MRGITLEEIAEATKIGTRSLRALEEQDFDKLPGGIFNKGFVRAYSRYLGIDEDQAVADYQTAVNEAQASGKLTRPEYAPPLIEEEPPHPQPVRIPWGLAIIVALLVVVGFAARSYYSQHGWAKLRREPTGSARKSSPAASAAAVATPAVPTPSATPADHNPVPRLDAGKKQAATPAGQRAKPAAAGQAALAESAKPAGLGGFTVKVRAKEEAWIEITVDGKKVTSELMKPNTDKVIHAKDVVVLFTGNAGGIEVSRNDQVLPPLGDSGVVKTVTITAQEVR